MTGINEVMPKDKHKAKIESIINNTPNEYRGWLRGRLNFSNEPTLHERLEILLNPTTEDPLLEADYYYLFLLKYEDKQSLIKNPVLICGIFSCSANGDQYRKQVMVFSDQIFF
ncbi:hypothetical protein F9802_18945 [Bacillus aerolatus]|uniref:Apea-like HEPN domain-containing protein n=1 Tax=Bacillus aerolatus TaxID=2653354 RepID=A0A6I1FAL2_9BACI|nr:HEPN domain-containing protein [Bacillus aerolatus]KAB7704104.1 hypothetical protein F9802_18945 [Bacillus aerolatus]